MNVFVFKMSLPWGSWGGSLSYEGGMLLNDSFLLQQASTPSPRMSLWAPHIPQEHFGLQQQRGPSACRNILWTQAINVGMQCNKIFKTTKKKLAKMISSPNNYPSQFEIPACNKYTHTRTPQLKAWVKRNVFPYCLKLWGLGFRKASAWSSFSGMLSQKRGPKTVRCMLVSRHGIPVNQSPQSMYRSQDLAYRFFPLRVLPCQWLNVVKPMDAESLYVLMFFSYLNTTHSYLWLQTWNNTR